MATNTTIAEKQVRQNFDKAAKGFAAADFIYHEINKRQLQRLDVIPLEPESILDCGAGIGLGTQYLLKRYKKAEVISLDLSSAMLQEARAKKRWRQKNSFVQGTAMGLPFANSSFDFVYSNLMLHWCNDLNVVFSEWQRVLKPGGLLMFTVFGPDTLKELRIAVNNIAPNQVGHSFIDMHDLGDALIKNRLLDPVMDVENIKIEYQSAEQFLQELRALGGRNLNAARLQHVFGTSHKANLLAELAKNMNNEGKLLISFEVVYGHAWASELSQQTKKDNVVQIPLQSIKIKR